MTCIACGGGPTPKGIDEKNYKNFPVRSDADHLTTRGAGGDDSWDNVWPLCRKHHQERHFYGVGWMVLHYEMCGRWLELNGRQDILDRVLLRKGYP